MTEEDSKEMLDSAVLNARAAIRQISSVMTQRDDLQPIVLEELHDALDGAFKALVHLEEAEALMAEYIVDTTDGILDARTTGELVRCMDCIYFMRCLMRKGDGSGYCWQARKRETVRRGKED